MCRHALRAWQKALWQNQSIASVAGTNKRSDQLLRQQGRTDRSHKEPCGKYWDRDITVNAVAPGLVETDMTAAMSDSALGTTGGAGCRGEAHRQSLK